MSVSAFIGSPGSGKTTALAWVARKQLKHPGKPVFISGVCVSEGHKDVFTNFSFPGAYKLDYDSLGKYNFEDALVLIDEISMFADSRNFKAFETEKKWFWSQHRKSRLSLIVATQAYDDMDKRIRNITDNYFKIEPFLPGLYISRFRHASHFSDIRNFQWASGYEWGKNQYFFTKPLYKLFDSFANVAIDKEKLPPPPLELWEGK